MRIKQSNKMRWLMPLLLMSLQSCVENSADKTSAQPIELADVLIQNVTVIDAKSQSLQAMDVLITGDTITSVKPALPNSDLLAKTRIDADGKYLIPGLWDAHVHLTFDKSVSSSMNRLFIANGVTSVRDTGGLLELVLQARERASEQVAPNIYFAGPLLDGVPTVYNDDAPGFPKIAKSVSSVEQAKAAVDTLAEAGAHLIKAYEMLAPEVFKAVLNRAKHHKLPVTGHVPLSMTAIEASGAGMNSMEHMRNLELACAENEEALLQQRTALLQNPNNQLGSTVRSHIHSQQRSPAVDGYSPERCSALVAALIKNQTWQVPTMALNLWAHSPYYGDPEWQKTYVGLPKSVAHKWISEGDQMMQRMSVQTPAQDKLMQHAQWQIEMLQRLVKAGVTIMAGTDTPIYFLTPGHSLHLELETLVKKGGMTPLQALEAATLTPARYFNLEGKMGTVEAGKMADLILLDKNPIKDIQNTKSIRAVFKGGQLFDREALDQLLLVPNAL